MAPAPRVAVEQACSLLAAGSPEAIAASADQLRNARALLARLELAGSRESAEALKELLHLKAALRKAATLLERAHEYHRGWQSWMALAGNGYQNGGKPAEATRRAAI